MYICLAEGHEKRVRAAGREFPRRVYYPPPATNEEIAVVLRKLQIWRTELKGLLISISKETCWRGRGVETPSKRRDRASMASR